MPAARLPVINKEFKRRREQLGTQSAAAQTLHVSTRYVQKIEAGDAQPSATLMKLLRIITTEEAPPANA